MGAVDRSVEWALSLEDLQRGRSEFDAAGRSMANERWSNGGGQRDGQTSRFSTEEDLSLMLQQVGSDEPSFFSLCGWFRV